MKKLLSLILAVLFALTALVACGETAPATGGTPSEDREQTSANTETSENTENSDVSAPEEITAETILGLWSCEVDAKEFIGVDAKMSASLEFKQGNEVILSYDLNILKSLMEEMLKDLSLKDMADMVGEEEATLQAAMEEENMTLAEYKAAIVDAGLAQFETMGNVVDGKLSATRYYKLEGDKLYLSDDAIFEEEEASTFTYKNGELTVDGITLKK